MGICRFVTVDPNDVEPSKLDEVREKWQDNPLARLYAPDALTAMRKRMARETDLRIVWGGKIKVAAGWMAGILEEVAFSFEHRKPELILGGFGGCARLVANFLASAKAPWPDQLSLTASADADRDARLTEWQHNQLQQRFDQIRERLAEFRARLFTEAAVNGLPAGLIKDVLHDETPRRVIHAAAKAAQSCAKSR